LGKTTPEKHHLADGFTLLFVRDVEGPSAGDVRSISCSDMTARYGALNIAVVAPKRPGHSIASLACDWGWRAAQQSLWIFCGRRDTLPLPLACPSVSDTAAITSSIP